MSDERAAIRAATAALAGGKPADAEAALRPAAEAGTRTDRVWVLFGIAAHRQGNNDGAIACLERAARLSPSADTLFTLGAVWQAAGNGDEAFSRYERALVTDPGHANAHNGQGAVWLAKGQSERAEQSFRRAVACDSNHAEATRNLGALLLNTGRPDAALEWLERAAALQTADPDPPRLLGRAKLALRDLNGAHAAFDAALAADPADSFSIYDRALALLAAGRYPEGFAALEGRTARADMRPRPANLPEWDGGDLSGKRLLLYAEQGQGDVLQGLRYAKPLAGRGATVIAEVHPGLLRIAGTVPGVAEAVPWGASPAVDCYCPYMSLPHRHGTVAEAVPWDGPYIVAPKSPAILSAPDGMRIGLSWAGNPQHGNDRNRSVPFDAMRPLFDLPGRAMVSLQTGSAAADIRDAGATAVHDLSPALSDFAVTAAALMELDLVITVDTALAHLAGAMGRPAWVLLPYAPDWRWWPDTLEPDGVSRWYPSLRLFRQETRGDWTAVIGRVRAALEKL